MKEKINKLERDTETFQNFTKLYQDEITNLLAMKKSDIEAEFNEEFKDEFNKLNKEKQFWLYKILYNYLKDERSKYPYEELLENIKSNFWENDTTILNLIINKDIFLEDGIDYFQIMTETLKKQE